MENKQKLLILRVSKFKKENFEKNYIQFGYMTIISFKYKFN